MIIGGIYKKKKYGRVFVYGVEFVGGLQLQVQLNSDLPISSEFVHQSLTNASVEGFAVRQVSKNEFIIRVPYNKALVERANEGGLIDEMKDRIIKAFSKIADKDGIFFTDATFIGPGVGENLSVKVIISVIFALILMFLYLWFRFRSWVFGVASVISLIHDVGAIVLMVLLFDYEISLDIIGAILFILGYSINDTVVVFARIRETLSEKKSGTEGTVNGATCFAKIINDSIIVTLRRTLLTSFFTAIAVCPLVFFGGEVLHSLSSAILIGIIFGTYSSIGVASSLLYDLRKFAV